MALTREEILSIVKMRRAEKSNREIADALGSTEGTVRRWIKKLRNSGYDIPKSKMGRRAIKL